MSKFYAKITLSLSRNHPLNSKFKKQKSGFTLLEILLVVGIIAILAGIVIVAINPSKQIATVRNTQRLSDIKQINSALQQYYITNGSYPNSLLGDLTEICDTGALASSSIAVDGTSCDGLINLSTTLVPTYLAAIPKDPLATTTAYTGYQVIKGQTSGLISLNAEHSELGQTIVLGKEAGVVADYTCGDPTSADCWSIGTASKAYGPMGTNTDASESEVLSNGKANTSALYALGSSYEAAYYCYTLTEDDMPEGTWYLPSYAELWAGWGALGSGGFPSGYYWSSTEFSFSPEGGAWGLDSSFGSMNLNGKYGQYSVRCLR
jgi:prepilin-type N-terminal cleavage/methylation domain-containing protein